MKITLLTIGSHGDVRPYVALGKALKAEGFTVCLGTHAEFKAFVLSHGLGFHPVKGNPRELLQSEQGQTLLQTGASPIKFIRSFRELAYDSMIGGFDDCLQACVGADAIVAPFFVAPVVAQIARKLKCKTILGYLQPTTPTGAFPVLMLPNLYFGGFLNKLSHTLARQVFWQIFRDVVVDWSRDSLNISSPPLLGPMRQMERDSLVLFAYSRHLVPKPGDWPKRYHQTGFWFLHERENYQPPEALSAFLKAGQKPVYVGFGSMRHEDPDATTALILEAIQKSGQRAIISSGWGGLNIDDLPEQVFSLETIPHDWLFPHMKAVVHHAGAGTTANGLYAGIPNITVPFFGDQPFWAQRLFGLGLGTRPIPRTQLTVMALQQALETVSQERFSERAIDIGGRVQREGGAPEAARLIARWLDVS